MTRYTQAVCRAGHLVLGSQRAAAALRLPLAPSVTSAASSRLRGSLLSLKLAGASCIASFAGAFRPLSSDAKVGIDVDEILRRLAAAEAATHAESAMRIGAEAATHAERALRVGAEAATDAERALRVAAEAAAEVASKRTFFFSRMLSIASSVAAEHASKSETRRGAPEPLVTSFEDVLDATFPKVDEIALATAWASFRVRHAYVWLPPTAATLNENRHVHPSIGCVLDAVRPSTLRLWHDKPAPDDVSIAQIRPDFALTGARDAASSTIGALLVVEVKLPGDIRNAAQ